MSIGYEAPVAMPRCEKERQPIRDRAALRRRLWWDLTRRGWSLAELAIACGVSHEAVRRSVNKVQRDLDEAADATTTAAGPRLRG